jgi:hypothetical protein
MSNGDMLKELGDILGDNGQRLTNNAALRLTLASVLDTNKKIEVLRQDRQEATAVVVRQLNLFQDEQRKSIDKLSGQVLELSCNPFVQTGKFFLAHKKVAVMTITLLVLLILLPNIELFPVLLRAILVMLGIPVDTITSVSP